MYVLSYIVNKNDYKHLNDEDEMIGKAEISRQMKAIK